MWAEVRGHIRPGVTYLNTHAFPSPSTEHWASKINNTQHVLYQIFFISQGIKLLYKHIFLWLTSSVKQRIQCEQIAATCSPLQCFYTQEKWKHADVSPRAERVGFPKRSSRLVSRVSELRCALGGINLNKGIKSQEWTILSVSPGGLLLFKLAELYGIFLCNT